MYARHATIPANTVLTGALTSCDNVCVVNGDITVTTDDGTRRITGFAVLPARAGYKRMGIAHAETEWVMVMATDAKTVADAEYAMTSEPESLLTRQAAICDHSNSDYETFVAELGWSSEVINDVVQNHLDLMVTARCFEMAEIRPSKIHGVGMFAKMHIGAGINIAPARIGEMRCACGRWMNHSKNPNCMFVLRDGMDGADVIAMRDIAKDEELTVNYRHSAAIAGYIKKEMW